jgi:transglutaminase-like putative cysteine protease
MNTRGPLLSLPTLATLLLVLALAAAPHALRQPAWLTALVLGCGLWRYLISRRGEQLPPSWLRTLLTVAVIVGIFGSYGSLFGRDAGTALLTGMTALKLLEMRCRRDVHVLMYLGYFLIATQFLYDQSIPMILYLGACSWLLTILLMATHQARPPLSPWRYSRQAGLLLLQALPLMLVLFVLFPRLPGPLWRLPDDARGAISGLGDTMSPGDITHLSQSDEVAFRVEFDGPPPPAHMRYWRGPVLSSYDGRTWRQSNAPVRHATISQDGEPVRYTVLLEPHNRRWLFSLDAPLGLPPEARWGNDLLIEATHSIHERRRYSLRSALQHQMEPQLGTPELAPYLTLPENAHPKARALAAIWRQQGLSGTAVLDAAASFFLDNPFIYTLQPPALPNDAVDQFLFQTQRGFCEHYASAFTVLMRAAGIPARVVTGYQGGEMNPLSDYLIVRQSDAHAWTEVWLQDQGWIRIDATAFIAPERVEHGLVGALPDHEPIPFLSRSGGLLKTLNLQWDALNTAWNRWVLGYSPESQKQLLERFGLGEWRWMIAALGIAMSGVLALIALFLLVDSRRPVDPLVAAYARFCRKLERRGLGRRPNEGPIDYASRISESRPELAAQVGAITLLYSRLRYGAGKPDSAGLRRLQRDVRDFLP